MHSTARIQANAISPIIATRETVLDLLVLKPDSSLALLTHGTHELPLDLRLPTTSASVDPRHRRRITGFSHALNNAVSLELSDASSLRISLDLTLRDTLVKDILYMLALTIPADPFFALHQSLLRRWSLVGYSCLEGVELRVFEEALWEVLDLVPGEQLGSPANPGSAAWQKLAANESIARFREDPALRKLCLPGSSTSGAPFRKPSQKPTAIHAAVLHALHHVAEDRRLTVSTFVDVPRLAPLICRLAMIVRPEWADYWKRLCPNAMPTWPSQSMTGMSYTFTLFIRGAECGCQCSTMSTNDCRYGLRT